MVKKVNIYTWLNTKVFFYETSKDYSIEVDGLHHTSYDMFIIQYAGGHCRFLWNG